MIDVCFSSCTGGNLNAIKHELGNSIKSNGVLAFDLQFNYGYLDDNIYEAQAWREANASKYFYKDITQEELNAYYKEELETIKADLSQLDKYLKSKEEIRLWISESAIDRCGLYWFCNYVKSYSNKVYLVSCPGYEMELFKNSLVENRRWASFSNLPYMATFADSGIRLNGDTINLYSELWNRLVKENTPLRIVIDGVVISTTEDFFDNALLQFISTAPKSQSTIMGEFLGKWQCAYVSFLCERIEALLKQELIEIVEDKVNDDGCYWARTIKLK